jgi:hypothetical protein
MAGAFNQLFFLRLLSQHNRKNSKFPRDKKEGCLMLAKYIYGAIYNRCHVIFKFLSES